MKVVHWTWGNTSGMHRAAESICEAEKRLGIDSRLAWTDSKDYIEHIFADIHVGHTFLPDEVWRQRPNVKVVWVGHATPEVIFSTAVEDGRKGRYGHGDSFMLMQYWMQHADAMVTFWPRHHAILKSMMDKRSIIECFPLGIDKTFWKKIPSLGKYVGTPSVFTAENAYWMKWPLDLFIMWPWVTEKISSARLHATYLPQDVHRWFFPLVNRNGASFYSYISARKFSHEELRNVFNSVDFYCGLVRYGDFNRICLEANACGCKTISWAGNPYSDFWIPEGDQRRGAEVLTEILKGNVEPRADKQEVADIDVTARLMIGLYERVLDESTPKGVKVDVKPVVQPIEKEINDHIKWIESVVPQQRVSDGQDRP